MTGPAALLFIATLVGIGAPLSGCGKQGEGEPCSQTNGNNDCDSAYVCVAAFSLRDPAVDRCCPPQGPITDSRCTPAGPVNTTDAGTGGTGGTTSEDAGDAAPEGGGSGGTGGTSGTGGTAGSGGSAGHDAGARDATSG